MLVSNDVFKEFKGAFTENYVLQQLVTHENLDIYYYSEENSKVEIDFLVQTDNRLLPIEVKAEENVKSKSFSQVINIDHAEEHLKGLRLSTKPYIDQGWMENIPLYGVSGYINSVPLSQLQNFNKRILPNKNPSEALHGISDRF